MLVNSEQSLKNQESTMLQDGKEVELYKFLMLFHSKHITTATCGSKITVSCPSCPFLCGMDSSSLSEKGLW